MEWSRSSPAVDDDDDVLGSAGRADVPGTHARVVVGVEASKVYAPDAPWVQAQHAPDAAKVLPSAFESRVILTHVTFRIVAIRLICIII